MPAASDPPVNSLALSVGLSSGGRSVGAALGSGSSPRFCGRAEVLSAAGVCAAGVSPRSSHGVNEQARLVITSKPVRIHTGRVVFFMRSSFGENWRGYPRVGSPLDAGRVRK